MTPRCSSLFLQCSTHVLCLFSSLRPLPQPSPPYEPNAHLIYTLSQLYCPPHLLFTHHPIQLKYRTSTPISTRDLTRKLSSATLPPQAPSRASGGTKSTISAKGACPHLRTSSSGLPTTCALAAGQTLVCLYPGPAGACHAHTGLSPDTQPPLRPKT